MAAGTGFSDDKYDVFRPELWSPRVNRFLKEKLYAANFFQDRSSELHGADTLHIPHISDVFSASDIPVTSGTVAATDISETKTDLTIDTWKGAAYYITKFEEREIMRRPNIITEYQSAMGWKLARALERSILALTTNIAYVPARAGLTTTSLVATNLETAMGILASNSVPKEECRFFFDPKVYWDDIMSIQKYYDASQFGKATLPHGTHDYLYGVPVTLTPNVRKEGGDLGVGNSIMHPTAIVHARTPVGFTTKPSENLRRMIIGDIIYGVTTLNSKRGVRLLATSN